MKSCDKILTLTICLLLLLKLKRKSGFLILFLNNCSTLISFTTQLFSKSSLRQWRVNSSMWPVGNWNLGSQFTKKKMFLFSFRNFLLASCRMMLFNLQYFCTISSSKGRQLAPVKLHTYFCKNASYQLWWNRSTSLTSNRNYSCLQEQEK